VLGCGSYLPDRVLGNAELSRMVDTSDEWITQRTGIHERHIAADGETTSEMALQAARAALAAAGIDAQSIDLIVLATSTPDNTFPASAVSVQAGLGITHGAAFDVQAVCSGFVYGLATVDGLLKTGAFKRALVVGSETFSRIIDWKDRTTCVLFGDGAGAVVLEAQLEKGTREDRGILSAHLRSDGRHKTKLYVDGGPSSTQTVGHLRMEGRAVFKHAVAMITDVIEDAFKATGYTVKDINWFVPHQANQRIIDDTAKKLGCKEAGHCARKSHHDRGQARQYIGCVHSSRPVHGRRAGQNQARGPRHAGGDGRRLHLGFGFAALVRASAPAVPPLTRGCQPNIV
jgi:3-oxoacyl-[acyl-carrier-protein] synthase-3